MEQAKMDKRVRETRRKLREVLLQTLAEKQLREITVKELCQRADLNRGTFYLHYRDVYDLFGQVQDEIFREISAYIDRGAEQDREGELGITSNVLQGIFRYLDANRQLLTVLLGMNRDQDFFERLTNIRREESVANWSRAYHASVSLTQAFYAFVVSGCVALLKRWVDTGMRESIDEVSDCAARFCKGSIRALAGDPS